MSQEPLQLVTIEGWPELQAALLSDWLRGLPGYNVLGTQTRWQKQGINYGFQVYSLFGDAANGFVAICEKNSYEVIIQYPKDDTKVLEEALRKTKVIDWRRKMKLPFAANHVISCVQRVLKDMNVEMRLLPSDTFVVEKNSPLFEDVSLPPGFTFELLDSAEYVDLIDCNWPHRYPSSSLYFQLLIDTKSGYGLFKDGELISWCFIGEYGFLTHLCTLEGHRKKGYAELTLKLISNVVLREKMGDVFAFCVRGNDNAFKLYNKIGFTKSVEIAWCYLN